MDLAPPPERPLALALGRARVHEFAGEDALADAVLARLDGHGRRVITVGASDVRDGVTEPTLFVYGAGDAGMITAGYVLGLGRDRARLTALLDQADLRRRA